RPPVVFLLSLHALFRSPPGCRLLPVQIEGANAIVVGGASGLGEATVRALAGRGANVTLADVNAEKGQALAEELEADFVACDVREDRKSTRLNSSHGSIS